MIEGLKVTVLEPEVKQLCLARAKFHDDRAQFYATQKDALPDLDQDSPDFSNSSNKKPQEMIAERIKIHKAQANELKFIAAHLKSGEDYLLDWSDMAKLGIVTNRY